MAIHLSTSRESNQEIDAVRTLAASCGSSGPASCVDSRQPLSLCLVWAPWQRKVPPMIGGCQRVQPSLV